VSALDTLVGEATLDALTDQEYNRLRAKQEAARRLASENFTGTVELGWDDLFRSDVAWTVQDLVPAGGTAFLVGRSNLGKTFAYVDMALNLTQGRPWLGKRTEPGTVLFVLGEGLSGFGARLQAWCAVNGVDPALIKDRVSFINGANISNDESLARIREVATRLNPSLVIWDTYNAVSGVASEDDAAMNALVLNRARTVSDTAAMLFVTHPTKSSEDSTCPVLRGSSALKGSVDTVMTLWVDSQFKAADDSEADTYLALSTEVSHGGKSRDAMNETLRGLYLTSQDASLVLARAASVNTDPITVTEEFLTDGMTTDAFMSAAGLAGQNKSRVMSKYLRKHPDVREEPAVGPNPARWYWK
jgi:RecA-family ATPase